MNEEIKDIMPTIMAAWYCKSTYASRKTPYIVEITDAIDKESADRPQPGGGSNGMREMP